jgi:hypothetical protein
VVDAEMAGVDDRLPKMGLDLKVILLVLTFHSAVMLTALIPNASYLKRLLKPVIDTYSNTTRSTHKWAMFENAPNVRNINYVLEATDEDGVVHELGPVLPGFQPFSGSSQQRSFFALFALPPYRETAYALYVESMTRALRGRGDMKVVSFSLREDTLRVGSLAKIRETGKYPEVSQRRYGPYPVADPDGGSFEGDRIAVGPPVEPALAAGGDLKGPEGGVIDGQETGSAGAARTATNSKD